jgi:hypothetical protein
MSAWQKFKSLLLVLWLVSIPLAVLSVGLMIVGGYPSETGYNYEVKAQQVFDAERVEDSDVTEFDNLTADEQDILYEAFKKTDHFMGSAQVTIVHRDRQFNTFTDWRTVESNGVLLLVAINEHIDKQNDPSQYEWWHHLSIFGLLYFAVGFLVLTLHPP